MCISCPTAESLDAPVENPPRPSRAIHGVSLRCAPLLPGDPAWDHRAPGGVARLLRQVQPRSNGSRTRRWVRWSHALVARTAPVDPAEYALPRHRLFGALFGTAGRSCLPARPGDRIGTQPVLSGRVESDLRRDRIQNPSLSTYRPGELPARRSPAPTR